MNKKMTTNRKMGKVYEETVHWTLTKRPRSDEETVQRSNSNIDKSVKIFNFLGSQTKMNERNSEISFLLQD